MTSFGLCKVFHYKYNTTGHNLTGHHYVLHYNSLPILDGHIKYVRRCVLMVKFVLETGEQVKFEVNLKGIFDCKTKVVTSMG